MPLAGGVRWRRSKACLKRPECAGRFACVCLIRAVVGDDIVRNRGRVARGIEIGNPRVLGYPELGKTVWMNGYID